MSKSVFKDVSGKFQGVAKEVAKNPVSTAKKASEFLAGAVSLFKPFPNVRMGYGITNRDQQVMTWRIPSGSSVQMYINPQNFEVKEAKQISSIRTKGGYVVQYWGEQLPNLSIRGTTGSSGIKGINVLRDIYRSEMSAFDLVAAQQLSEVQQVLASAPTLEDGNITEPLTEAANRIRNNNFLLRPSLASLAASVLLFYQGVQYKGFFTEFSVTESVDRLGLFDYSMTFMATDISGRRNNYLPWHKEAMAEDMAGQLINGIGNALRRAVGMSDQLPTQYHPDNASYSFGGNTLAPALGLNVNPEDQYEFL